MPTYKGTIVGGIWWPMGAMCALDVQPFDADNDTEALDTLATVKSGDFSSVLDAELWRIDNETRANAEGRIVETVTRETLVKAFSEEAELAYIDCMSAPEDDKPDTEPEDDGHTFSLIDDGTLDTVLRCNACGQEERFNPEPANSEGFEEGEREAAALEMAQEEHECRRVE